MTPEQLDTYWLGRCERGDHVRVNSDWGVVVRKTKASLIVRFEVDGGGETAPVLGRDINTLITKGPRR